MTTPAINTDEAHYGYNASWWRQPPFVNDWREQSPSRVLWDRERQQRPQSKSIALRGDRTRPPGPWFHEGLNSSGPLGSYIMGDRTAPGWERLVQGCLVDPLGYDQRPSTNSNLTSQAVFKAVQQVKGGKVNLGVALAEARQTATLLGSTATGIARDIDRMMSGKRGLAETFGKMASWKKIPERYLEACYGWTPLLNDILGSAEAIASAQTAGMTFNLSVKGTASEDLEFIKDYGTNVVLSRYVGSVKRVTSCSMNYYLPGYLLPLLSSLGLTNPFEVAWEKVPYSFVLDWMLPIGPWLGTLDAQSYLQFREGSITEFVRCRASAGVRAANTALVPVKSIDVLRPGSYRYYYMRRVLMPGPPTVDFPRLKNPLNLDKASKGLALLTQVFKRWA